MAIQDFLFRATRRIARSFGFDVFYMGDLPRLNKRIWFDRLKHAKELGLAPKTILDGGAFQGLWSKEVARLFPGAQLILVEPNPFVQDLLAENISHIQPDPVVLNLALGESCRTASFNIWHDADTDQGASLLNHVVGPAARVIDVQVDTLDNIAERLSLTPDLLKLDLQGSELAALRGGETVLEHVEFAIIEFGCLDAYVGRTTPHQLLDIMYDHDFCLYDIVSLGDRPYDSALTGGDFFFVKNGSILRGYKGWE